MTDTIDTSAAPIPGVVHQYDDPSWAPLLGLAGHELAAWFMWTCEVCLEDGARVHAYKHRETRRYMHVAEDGRCFAYVAAPSDRDEPSAYRPITRAEALEGPLGPWQFRYLSAGDRRTLTAFIQTARETAARGELIEVQPAWLEAQRAYEAQQRANEAQEAA